MNAFIHCSLLHEYGHSWIFITLATIPAFPYVLVISLLDSSFQTPFQFWFILSNFIHSSIELWRKRNKNSTYQWKTYSINFSLSLSLFPSSLHHIFPILMSFIFDFWFNYHEKRGWERPLIFLAIEEEIIFSFSLNYLQVLQ